jgi:hypothetical protein
MAEGTAAKLPRTRHTAITRIGPTASGAANAAASSGAATNVATDSTAPLTIAMKATVGATSSRSASDRIRKAETPQSAKLPRMTATVNAAAKTPNSVGETRRTTTTMIAMLPTFMPRLFAALQIAPERTRRSNPGSATSTPVSASGVGAAP